MESDLTERLAAKLEEGIAAKLPYEERAERLGKWGSFIPEFALEVSTWADQLLAFLLSEPELVAGLAPEVKREVLRQLLEAEIVDAGIHNETHRSCVLQTAHDILTGAANG